MRKITRSVGDYTFDWYTDRELIEIFQPDESMLRSKLIEREAEYEEKARPIQELLVAAENGPSKDKWFWEIIATKVMIPCSGLLETRLQIVRIGRFLAIRLGRVQKAIQIENFEEKKDRARAQSIYEIARNFLELKPSGKNFIGICPLHREKTPSFYLYTESNRFHCFGCQRSGDVITLTQELHGIGFVEAVKLLNNEL